MYPVHRTAHFRIEHRQYVDRARGHLDLGELIGSLGFRHRRRLTLFLFGRLTRCDQGALDVAERSQHRLVIGAREFRVTRLRVGELPAQRAPRNRGCVRPPTRRRPDSPGSRARTGRCSRSRRSPSARWWERAGAGHGDIRIRAIRFCSASAMSGRRERSLEGIPDTTVGTSARSGCRRSRRWTRGAADQHRERIHRLLELLLERRDCGVEQRDHRGLLRHVEAVAVPTSCSKVRPRNIFRRSRDFAGRPAADRAAPGLENRSSPRSRPR